MRRAALLAFGLMVVGIYCQDNAEAQTSATPPVSLTPPKGSPPRAATKNSAATSDRVPPATSGLPQLPRPAPAADYDGFSVGADDNDAPSQMTPPARSRAASGLDAQTLVDQEDEALKRKLTICQKCK